MRFTVILFALFVFSTFSNAQSEWTGNIGFHDRTKDIQITPDGNILVLQGGQHDENGMTLLDGNFSATAFYDFNTYTNAYGANTSNVVKTADSGFAFHSSRVECDLIVQNFVKLDENLDFLWAKNADYGIEHVAATSDSGVIFSTGNSFDYADFMKYDKDGNLIWEKETFFSIYDITVDQNDILYLLTDQGTWIYNALDGSQIQNGIQVFGEHIEATQDTTIIVIGESFISTYSESMELISTITLTTNETVKDYYAGNEFLSILSEADEILLYDYSLNLINNFTLENNGHDFNSIAIKENELLIGSMEKNGTTEKGNSSAFIKEYDFDGTNINTQNDIGATSVSPSEPQIYEYDFYGLYVMDFPDLNVEIINYGNSTINSLTLNSEHPTLPNGIWCPFVQSFSKSFTALDIQPGETGIVSWDDYKIWFNDYPEGIVDICIWTSSPNSESDLDATNDLTCLDFLVSDKEVFHKNEFSITPNPTSGLTKINYTFPSPTAEIIITNSIGQINSRYFLEHMESELIIDNLSAGLYFITLMEEGRIVGTERLVVH